MKNKVKIIVGFLGLMLLAACSTKKDAFLNRSYHGLATKYNVLFNGNEALRKGLTELNTNYEDNYWEILPIEPLKVDKIALPGMTGSGDNSPAEFEAAEEKAVKAVQKHSMLIARQERNKQIDDAYLLLGKARYYSKRFVPALEAFNFVITNYPSASLINETKIWQAKTLIRLQNEEQAIDNLITLLKSTSLSEENLEAAHTAMAMAYTSTGNVDQIKKHLNEAVATQNNKEQTARNLFVLGQIYSSIKEIDSSNSSFQRIINLKKAPHKYLIHAAIEKAKNAGSSESGRIAQEELSILIKDRDNRPFLDELYFHYGRIEEQFNKEIALEYYNKSLAASTASNLQKERTYEAVGNVYFDQALFLKAGAYYDSILQISQDRNSKRIRRLIRKRNNLNEVILYENIAKENDSILALVDMSDIEQAGFFTTHIEKLKEAEAKLKLENTQKSSGLFNFASSNSSEKEASGTWYFYNVQTVGFGAQEFDRIWGNRPLEDNWRLSNKTQLNFGNNADEIADRSIEFDDSKKYDLAYYLELIPTEANAIELLRKDRNNAYYKLGLIYKEQFKEEELAKGKLEKLLSYNPEEKLRIPATYHLYKIYEQQGLPKSDQLRTEIVTNYKDSKYAQIILNPLEVVNQSTENSPESEYAKVFYEYKEEKLDTVIDKSTIAISKFEGQAIVPKFELLKAYALGKKNGLEAFKTALEYVAMNYPNTEEGAKALEVIETIKSKI